MKLDRPRASVLGAIALASLIGSAPAAGIEPKPTRGYFVQDRGGCCAGVISTEYTQQRLYSGLPAGKYVGNASLEFTSDDPDRRVVECLFTIGPASAGHSRRANVGGGPGGVVSLPLDIAFEIGSPKDVGIICRADVSGTVFRGNAALSIIRVDSLKSDRPIIVW